MSGFRGGTRSISGTLRKRPTVIYLIVPEQISYYAVLLNLFYTACFEALPDELAFGQ